MFGGTTRVLFGQHSGRGVYMGLAKGVVSELVTHGPLIA